MLEPSTSRLPLSGGLASANSCGGALALRLACAKSAAVCVLSPYFAGSLRRFAPQTRSLPEACGGSSPPAPKSTALATTGFSRPVPGHPRNQSRIRVLGCPIRARTVNFRAPPHRRPGQRQFLRRRACSPPGLRQGCGALRPWSVLCRKLAAVCVVQGL